MNLVFDSSALIAFLEDEPGAALVEGLLRHTDGLRAVHSVNLCEVYYGAHREHGEEIAQETVRKLRKTGLLLRDDMDEEFWQGGARIKSEYHRISLADCFCAVLANRVDAEVITCDRREFGPLANAKVCRVRFIR